MKICFRNLQSATVLLLVPHTHWNVVERQKGEQERAKQREKITENG